MNTPAAITAAVLALLVAAPASASVERSRPKTRIGVSDIAGADCTGARVAAVHETHWGKSKSQAETASGNTSYQNHHRWYSPDLGRDLSAEPLLQSPGFARVAAAQGLSMPAYAYAANDPTRFIDPTGLLVTAVYDRATGLFWIYDDDTKQEASMIARSGVPKTSASERNGPIPVGKYWIYDHPDPDFFRLDADDGLAPDDFHRPTGRSLFRVHKTGRGLTTGCISASKESSESGAWEKIRDLISNTRTIGGFERNPNYSWPFVTRYGELYVIDSAHPWAP